MKRIIKGINVFTHITGKTLEENLNFTTIRKNNVPTGVPVLSSITIEMDVQTSICVASAMVGKSKSTILKITNWIHVSMESNVISLIALIIIHNQTEDNLFHSGLRYSQRREKLTFLQITTCLIWEIKLKIEISWEE
jgi:hypothetical protein